MARGRSGVISKEYKGEENTAYHDVIKLFKIYRAVNWQMQIKINQVKRRFHMEYGTVIYRQQNQRTLMKSWTSWNHIFRNMQEFTGLHIFVGVNRLLKL